MRKPAKPLGELLSAQGKRLDAIEAYILTLHEILKEVIHAQPLLNHCKAADIVELRMALEEIKEGSK